MTLWIVFSGFAAGAFAGSIHLAMTWCRAFAVSRGALGLALLTLPLSVALTALLLFLAVRPSLGSALAALLGFWLVRVPVLASARRS